MDIVKKQENSQLALRYQFQTLHNDLQLCLTAEKVDKIALAEVTNQLLPGGEPDFENIVHFPSIKQQAEENYKLTALMLSSLVKDFCSSYNVVRNMNEDQIIEAAIMLIDDAGNFRMEDYVMMFSMAKKGRLGVKIMDRIDIDVINQIADAYFDLRKEAGYKIQQKQIESEEGKIDNVEQIVGPEAWTNLLNKVKAEYDEGKTGYRMTEDQELEAKKARVAHAAKHFWGENEKK